MIEDLIISNLYQLVKDGKTEAATQSLIKNGFQIPPRYLYSLMICAIDKGHCDLVSFILNKYHTFFKDEAIIIAFKRSVLNTQGMIATVFLNKMSHKIDLLTRQSYLNPALFYDCHEVVHAIIQACSSEIDERAKYSILEKSVDHPQSFKVLLKEWNELNLPKSFAI